MQRARSNRKTFPILLTLSLWLITAWLVYPLVTLDSVDAGNAKQYLYRSAAGIAIMIILFGKTVFDLFFPQMVSRNVPLLNTIILTIYSLLIAGSIIFMVSRMIVLYIRSQDTGSIF
jgi:hypothetical protein